jgi:hypothetical protein
VQTVRQGHRTQAWSCRALNYPTSHFSATLCSEFVRVAVFASFPHVGSTICTVWASGSSVKPVSIMSTLSTCHLLPNRGIVGCGALMDASSSRDVLAFFCVWEQHKRVMGRKAPILMLYYTSDDSMELRQLPLGAQPEEVLAAPRQASVTIVLKRQRVAKYVSTKEHLKISAFSELQSDHFAM